MKSLDGIWSFVVDTCGGGGGGEEGSCKGFRENWHLTPLSAEVDEL